MKRGNRKRFRGPSSGCPASRSEIDEEFAPRRNQIPALAESEHEGNFPPIKQFNRRFALWLMSCVNVETCTLNIGDKISIRFTKSDAGHVLGIPCTGKRVVDDRFPAHEAKERVLDNFLGNRFRERRSIKLVQQIIEREYSSPMSNAEEETFKVAFVVFVVSNLLAPSAKHDYASIDYWKAIEDPGTVHTYDWSEYVIVKLLEAVTKLKHDVSSNIRFPIISGCSIFLQVFYLDSLDIQGLSMSHNTFPRIREFSYDRMQAMIASDSNFERHICSDDSLPCAKLRDSLRCIYTWAINQSTVRDEPGAGYLLAIWEVAVAMVHLLNIPLEAAGPLYVAAADFQQQINSGLFVNGTQAIKFMTVLVSIMIPYSRGFRYQHANKLDSGSDALESAISNGISMLSEPSRLERNVHCNMACGQWSGSLNHAVQAVSRTSINSSHAHNSPSFQFDRMDIGDHVERSFNSAIASIDGMPHYLNVNLRVASAMTQFYSLIRRLKPSRAFDLNSEYPNANPDVASLSYPRASTNSPLPSPWEMGYDWYQGGSSISSATLNIDCLREYESLVIAHMEPKYIQVSGIDFRSQLLGHCEMELDMFDALIRTVRQEDDECYASCGEMRWRHFFESDFMERILAGTIDIMDSGIRDSISLANTPVDLSKSKIVFFPALLQCSWVCFAWSLEENVINVFDPSSSTPVPESRVVSIERACYLLKLAVQTLCDSVFTGVSHQCKSATMRMLTLPRVGLSRFNCTGALCYLFCCCFDGGNLVPRDIRVDHDFLTAKILHEILRLKRNEGIFPSSVLQATYSAMEGTATPRTQDDVNPLTAKVTVAEVMLRKFELSDADAMMVWASDPQVAASCRWDAYESTDPLLAFIRDTVLPHPWFRAICVESSGDGSSSRPVVGAVSVSPTGDPCRAELGYVLARAHWGRGVATAAVKRAVAAVFAEVQGLQRIEALVDVANPASQRVLEKAGFTREAVLRKCTAVKGVVRDMVQFSFIDTDPVPE